MNFKLLFFALASILLFSSCLQKIAENLTAETKEDKSFKKAHNSITVDMTMDQVANLLGDPMNRQFRDNLETWQYCLSSMEVNQYFVVSFDTGKVYGISNYYLRNNEFEGCYRCEKCFNEIQFSTVDINKEQNSKN